MEEGSKYYLTQDSSILKQSVEKLLGKMEVVSANIINLNKFKNRTDLRLNNLEELTKKQIKIDQFYVEKKSITKELYTHVNEKLSVFSEKVVQFSQELEEKQIQFESKVKENEKNTIWKIQDCEKLL
jgi:hypothetical protein